MNLEWHSAGETHTGKHRECNEDALLQRPEVGLWAVADGMGGHDAGEVASQAIANELESLGLSGTLSQCVDALEDRLVEVNDWLRMHARTQFKGGTVGSTVVTMLSRGRTGVALWAGDSRLYRLREGRLEQITRDHNPISDLLDVGAVSEADAMSADTNIITRAVGGQPELHLDLAVFEVFPNDTYLLCSDGLYREVTFAALCEELSRGTVADSVEALLAQCLTGAARDNITLIVARAEAS